MTPSARVTALLLAVAAFAVAFLIGALVTYHLTSREPVPHPVGPRHLGVTVHRHRLAPRHEWLLWTVSTVTRFFRYEDGGPKAGITFAVLFLAFSVLIGVQQ